MGEMADEHLNQLMEHGWFSAPRRSAPRRRFVSCKHCGVDRLEWAYRTGKWVLVHPKGQKIHRCDPAAVNRKIANLLDNLAP